MTPAALPLSAYLRLSQAAANTGIPESTLRAAIMAGELVGVKLGTAWHTSHQAINEWIEESGPPR